MKNYKVLIVGYGTVGKNLYKTISKLKPDINDNRVRKDYLLQEYDSLAPYSYPPSKYDFAFICVDTPLMENGVDLDISQVQSALEENNADIYVIKSTCPMGTTKLFNETFGGNKTIVYSPEYYGSTQHCNNFDFNFTILGGDKGACIKVQQLLQHCYDARHTFHITDSRTAELAKFMENAWIATKVSFCNQFYQIAQDNGIDYEELRELFILDPRVNPAHTFVYADQPYWTSHCLDKDVPHIAMSEPSAELLRHIIQFNEHQKENPFF
jgi:UDP-glucose 6-dehydrogenase